MLKQIRGHWYKPTYPFFFSNINYIDKKNWSNYLGTGSLSEEFYEKMAAILNKMAAISCVDKKTSRPTECAQHWYCLQNFVRISFLAHLTQRVMWAILITWRPSSSSVVRRPSVVRRKLFQKSSPLKVLDQWKPNLVWIITRVSSFKIVSGDAVHQPTWPLLLKIEHMVKLQVFGNNSKTVSNIKNLTWGKNDQHIKIYLPCNFEVNLITHLGVIALFSSNL